jgi:hypothetical protein
VKIFVKKCPVYCAVKLTPGTGKRGKACKTALAIFIGDKATSQRSGIENINPRMYNSKKTVQSLFFARACYGNAPFWHVVWSGKG